MNLNEFELTQIQKFLETAYPEILKNVMINLVRQIADKELEEVGLNAMMLNEQLGIITRANALAIRYIKSAFSELERFKKVEIKIPPNNNPAR